MRQALTGRVVESVAAVESLKPGLLFRESAVR